MYFQIHKMRISNIQITDRDLEPITSGHTKLGYHANTKDIISLSQAIETLLHKFTNTDARAADVHIVDEGMPYFPFLNSPFRKGKKHNNIHTLHITSPILNSWLPYFKSDRALTIAARCTNKRVVAGTKIGDPLNVN